MSNKNQELVEFVHARRKKVLEKVVLDGNTAFVEKYIPDGPLIGCVLAKRVVVRGGNGKFRSAISMGWSQVNRSEGDTFKKNEAIRIARERANGCQFELPPKKAVEIWERMADRASRYFQRLDWA